MAVRTMTARRALPVGLAACALLASWGGLASASALDRAKELKEEGMDLLRVARAPGGDVIKGSWAAVARFEAGAALLGDPRPGSSEADLLEDLNGLIFWTKRTTPMDMSEIMGGASSSSSGGSSPPSSRASPSGSGASPGAARPQTYGAAKAALEEAERFASRNAGQPISCAARFFLVADQYKDVSDIAFRAVTLAQHYQRMAIEAAERALVEARMASLTPDERLELDGDRARDAGDYAAAAAKYEAAIAVASTPARHRKLGHMHFNMAQEHRNRYAAEYLSAKRDFDSAKARKNQAGMDAALRRHRDMSGIADAAKEKYSAAQKAFEAAHSASDGIDLDSELHVALTLVVRTEKTHQARAAATLARILVTYYDRLRTDEDRTLYALAETYAGPAAVERAKKEIARALRAKSSGSSGGGASASGGAGDGSPAAPGPKDPYDMADAEIRSEIASLETDVKKLEIVLRTNFSKQRYDEMSEKQARLKELSGEAAGRGLKP